MLRAYIEYCRAVKNRFYLLEINAGAKPARRLIHAVTVRTKGDAQYEQFLLGGGALGRGIVGCSLGGV